MFVEYFTQSQSPPDVILLDLDMPVMNGFEFINAFRQLSLEKKEKIRIIVLTSSEDPRDIKKAKEMGVSYYLTKPISEDKLTAALQNESM